MRDPYTYPNTTVLINKLNIRDEKILERVEASITYAKMQTTLPSGKFDYDHLKVIHKHLFGELYEWAGKERTISISKGNSLFALPERLANCTDKTFSNLNKDKCLKDLPLDTFIDKAAFYFNEINAIHPFREGNGRTNRVFFSELAHTAGYQLNWEKVEPDFYLKASISGFEQSDEQMKQVFRSITKPSKEFQVHHNTNDQVNWLSSQYDTEWQNLKNINHRAVQWMVKFHKLGQSKATEKEKQKACRSITRQVTDFSENTTLLKQIESRAPSLSKAIFKITKSVIKDKGIDIRN